MDHVKNHLEAVADKLLASWAAEKTSLLLIFRIAKDSGGSTRCFISKISPGGLTLSWPGEFERVRGGEFVISLQGASRTISDIDVAAVVSGVDLINPSENFVLITLPSGDQFWLVSANGFQLDDAFNLV